MLSGGDGPSAADFYRGSGNFMNQGGGAMANRMAQAQLGQAQQLGSMAQQGKQFGLGQALDARRGELQQEFQGGENAKNRAAQRQNLLDELGARERAAKEKAEGDKAAKGQDMEEGLRNKYIGLDPVKAAVSAKTFYGQIANAPGTGTGDLAMIYGLAKLFDPGGRVTDSDAEMAAKTGGLQGQLQGYYNDLQAKGKLSAAARKDMKAEAGRLLRERVAAAMPIRASYRKLADEYGVNADRVTIPLGFEEDEGPGARGGSFDVGGPVRLPEDDAAADAAFGKLPAGAKYIGPDGVTRTK